MEDAKNLLSSTPRGEAFSTEQPPEHATGPVEDAQLLAYLDGALAEGPRIALGARLAADEEMRQRLRALHREQLQMEQALRHTHAPTTQTLGEYALGLLSPSAARALESQMRAYPHLAYEANKLRHELAKAVPQAEPSQKTEQGIGQLAARLRRVRLLVAVPISASANLGVRGEEHAPQRLYSANGTKVILEIQEEAPASPGERPTGQHTILGLVVAEASSGAAGNGPLGESAVQLFEGDRFVAETKVDALGNFVLPHLPTAVYDLIISDSQTDIVINDIAP